MVFRGGRGTELGKERMRKMSSGTAHRNSVAKKRRHIIAPGNIDGMGPRRASSSPITLTMPTATDATNATASIAIAIDSRRSRTTA